MRLFDNLRVKVVSICMSVALAATMAPVSAFADTGNSLGASISAVVDTLLGVSAEHSYKLSFAPGAENVSGEMLDIEVVDAPDAKLTLPSCGYVFEGHSFAGWKVTDPAADSKRKANEEPLPDIGIPDGQEMTNLVYVEPVSDADPVVHDLHSYASDGHITFTAVWSDVVSDVKTEETSATVAVAPEDTEQDTAATVSENDEQNTEEPVNREASAVESSPVTPSDASPVLENPVDQFAPLSVPIESDDAYIVETDRIYDYTIVFKQGSAPDGAQIDGYMDDAVVNATPASENMYVLDACAYTVEGYKFAGWSVGGIFGMFDTTVPENQELVELRYTDGEGNTVNLKDYADAEKVITLTAKWEKNLAIEDFKNDYGFAYLMVSDTEVKEGEKIAGSDTASVVMALEGEKAQSVQDGLREDGVPFAQDVSMNVDNGFAEPLYDSPKAAFETLEKISAEDVKPDIVMIDTGAPHDCANLVGSVSFVDGESDTSDKNGHASSMADIICEQAPDATFYSIRVADDMGRIRFSAVYAALEYAISMQPKVISIPLTARGEGVRDVMGKLVDEATAKGIQVVGAAGNEGLDASGSAPGGIASAIVVGACDDTGSKLPASNWGDTVDYYAVGLNTSEACSRVAGLLASGKELTETNGVYRLSVTEEQAKADIESAPEEFKPATNSTGYVSIRRFYSGSAHRLTTATSFWGWGSEGVSFYEPSSSSNGSTIESYNPNNPNFIYETYCPGGWENWGRPFYTSEHWAQTVRCVYNPNAGVHLYTPSWDEYSSLCNAGWNGQGDVFGACNIYTQTVKVRYQNADGSWGGYSNVINSNYASGSTCSWSRGQDSTYKAASVSYGVYGANTKYVDVARRTATNTIRVRYQNADGSWGGYSNASSGSNYVGQVRSWSRAQDATYQAASGSITGTASNQTKDVSVYRRTATNTIRARYQNADGGWGGYSNVSTGSNYVGQVRSWSRAADATYQAASGSITGTASNQTKDVSVYRQLYYIDLNGTLDGTGTGSIGGYGTANVVVNGSTVGSNVGDYYAQHITGAPFSVTVTASEGRSVTSGGTVTAATTTSPSKAVISGNVGTATYDARFTMVKNTYSIAYNANGADGSMSNTSGVVYDDDTVLASNTFTKTGYSFAGWATSPTGSKAYDDGATVSKLASKYVNNETATLYATWSPNPYHQTVMVRYQNSDGSWGEYTPVIDEDRFYDSTCSWSRAQDTIYEEASISYTVEAEAVKYVDVARKSATATVWYRLQNADGTWPSVYTVGASADKLVGSTLSYTYAETSTHRETQGNAIISPATSASTAPSDVMASIDVYRKSYTVVFNSNGGTGSMDAQTLLVGGTPVHLTANAFRMSGYSFTGWNTEANGSGTAYTNSQEVAGLSGTDGATVTLYAQWSPVWYESGADSTIASDNVAHDAGTYVVTIPKYISYSELSVGDVDTDVSYEVRVCGSLESGRTVAVDAVASGQLIDGDVSTGDSSSMAISVHQQKDSWSELDAYGSVNADGSLSGTTSVDTVSVTGELKSTGTWIGYVQYTSRLL